MGQVVSEIVSQVGSAITSAQDKTQVKAKARDALNALTALAGAELEGFYERVTNPTFDTTLVPIHKIITRQKWVYCKTETEPLKIGEVINQTASQFASGATATGIGTIIDFSLRALFGASAASMGTEEFYAISVGSLAGVQRIDIKTFAYAFTSEALIDVTEGCQGAVAVLSSVDTTGLSNNDVRVIVQTTYGSAEVAEQQKVYEQVVTAIHEEDKTKPASLQSHVLLEGNGMLLNGTSEKQALRMDEVD